MHFSPHHSHPFLKNDHTILTYVALPVYLYHISSIPILSQLTTSEPVTLTPHIHLIILISDHWNLQSDILKQQLMSTCKNQKETSSKCSLQYKKFKSSQSVTFDRPRFSAFYLSRSVQDPQYTIFRSLDRDRRSGHVLTSRALAPRHTSARYQPEDHTQHALTTTNTVITQPVTTYLYFT